MRYFIFTILSYILKLYLRLRGASVGKRFRVDSLPRFLLRDGACWGNISIGDDVHFDGRVYFRLRKKGRISIGNNVSIATEVWLVTANESELKIGDRVSIGSYSVFNGGHGISIGNDCLLAGFVYLVSSNHESKKNALISSQGYIGAKIEIGDDVWIGGQVCILPGVTVEDGGVIGAGSVVTKNVGSYEISAGVPSKNIGFRE